MLGGSLRVLFPCRAWGLPRRGVCDGACMFFCASFPLVFSATLQFCSGARSSFSFVTRFRVANVTAGSAEKVGTFSGGVDSVRPGGLLGVDVVTFLSVWQICWGLW